MKKSRFTDEQIVFALKQDLIMHGSHSGSESTNDMTN